MDGSTSPDRGNEIKIWHVRYLSNESVYDRKVAIYTNTIGLIGPLVAIYFVISMDLFYLNCLVICVITYVGATMLYQGLKNKNDAVADTEEEEKKTIDV